MPLIEKLAERAFWTDCLPLARRMAAIVALSLALDQADAAEPITGSATDGHLVVGWTYDLDAATGELSIENIDADNQGHVFGLDGLIPDGASNLKCNGIPSELQECEACPASAVFCPDDVLFRYVPPGNTVAVSFDLPPANWVTTLGRGNIIYGPGYLFSAATGIECAFLSKSTVEGFVTVTPMSEGCLQEDGNGISMPAPTPSQPGLLVPSVAPSQTSSMGSNAPANSQERGSRS